MGMSLVHGPRTRPQGLLGVKVHTREEMGALEGNGRGQKVAWKAALGL